jgi:uncharacterized protein YunC (DUF1805 family)
VSQIHARTSAVRLAAALNIAGIKTFQKVVTAKLKAVMASAAISATFKACKKLNLLITSYSFPKFVTSADG